MIGVPSSLGLREKIMPSLRWFTCLTCLIPLSAHAQQAEWAKMPRMQLERQFAGPLQDTIIQRWRDPADGTICYIYLPFTAAHSPPQPNGYVQYGSNTIGSVSCVPGGRPAQTPTAAPKAAPKSETGAPKAAPRGEPSQQ
jgi:hypothetical protein